jgi:hypothetical protein
LELGSSILELGIAPLESTPVSDQWDGAPITIQAGQTVVMPETPNGSAIFTCENLATINNAGSITLSYGSIKVSLNVYPFTQTPEFQIQNWAAQALSVANTSPQRNTPIRIQLIGTGLAGTNPVNLPLDGTSVSLNPGACAQSGVPPQYLQFAMQASGGETSIVAVIGGPIDSYGENSYVFGLNFPQNTGPGSGPPVVAPPPGYYQTTSGNNIAYQFAWIPFGGLLFCADLSSGYNGPISVYLRKL